MSLKVEYASRRDEVWSWYCRAWRRDLWKFHATMCGVVCAIVTFLVTDGASPTFADLLTGAVWGFLSVAWMPAIPMLLFAPEARSVELDQDGIATTIDGQSSRRSWKDIESITQENGYVVMQSRKGSAFLIPPRAFASTDEQQRFLSFALDALTASLMPPAEPSVEPLV